MENTVQKQDEIYVECTKYRALREIQCKEIQNPGDAFEVFVPAQAKGNGQIDTRATITNIIIVVIITVISLLNPVLA